jgi:hypothetical protein
LANGSQEAGTANYNYVSAPDVTPMIEDFAGPTGLNYWYRNSHRGGQKTFYIDGHGVFLNAGDLKPKYFASWTTTYW